MPAFLDSKHNDRRWRFRKVVKMPDGSMRRVTGTPEVNTKAAAEAAETEAVRLLLTEGPRPTGRPLQSDEARTINLTVRVSEPEQALYARIAANHGCESVADAMRLGMELLARRKASR